MKIGNIAGLAVFAKVVEFESFSKAAEDLGLSKSAVCKQIAALEELNERLGGYSKSVEGYCASKIAALRKELKG